LKFKTEQDMAEDREKGQERVFGGGEAIPEKREKEGKRQRCAHKKRGKEQERGEKKNFEVQPKAFRQENKFGGEVVGTAQNNKGKTTDGLRD